MPVLAKESFNGNYQMYTCRADKERNIYITNYLDKSKPGLITLIDEKKVKNNKIQLDVAVNLKAIRLLSMSSLKRLNATYVTTQKIY